MKRREVIFFIALVGIVGLFIWRVLAAREMKLRFGGFRHVNSEERWYADFWFTNTSPQLIHCTGYLYEDSKGWQTNESLLDFQCTVGFQEKQVQEWPLWFASYLDLKPGEAVRLGLNVTLGQAPKRVGLKYSSDPGPRNTNAVYAAWRKLKRHIPMRLLGRTPLYETVLCPTELVFPEGEAAKTNGFRLIFSPTPFPGYTTKLEWRREEHGGNWYWSPDYQMEGWLCPALFKYFTEAPKELYGRAQPKP